MNVRFDNGPGVQGAILCERHLLEHVRSGESVERPELTLLGCEQCEAKRRVREYVHRGRFPEARHA